MFYFLIVTSILGLLYVLPDDSIKNTEIELRGNEFSTQSSESENSEDPIQHEKTAGNSGCDKLKENYYLVSIRRLKDHFHVCSGSLIASRWVLTAAYCFSTKIIPNVVILGTPNINPHNQSSPVNISENMIRHIKKYYVHERYDNLRSVNDIALVLLAGNVEAHVKSTIVKIIYEKVKKDLSKECDSEDFVVLLWAGVNANNPPPYRECNNDPYITNNKCPKNFKYLDSRMFCTNGPTGSKNTCLESIGAPIFCHGIQYGLVSYADGCGHPRSPRYYTRIDHHFGYIYKTLVFETSKEPKLFAHQSNHIFTALISLHFWNFLNTYFI